jgi:orotate phosphoribosyltransferase
MDKEEIYKLLLDVGAIVRNSHIVYTSGRHGSDYVNKDAIYLHPSIASKLATEMAKRHVGMGIEVVCGPERGGIILSQWVAYHLSKEEGREVLAVFAEKGNGGYVLKRGYSNFIRGKRVLLVEDILTTGKSIRMVVELIRGLGGDIVGITAICNRGNVTQVDVWGVRIDPLIELSLPSWSAEECPLCKKGVPINEELGKGANFRRG